MAWPKHHPHMGGLGVTGVVQKVEEIVLGMSTSKHHLLWNAGGTSGSDLKGFAPILANDEGQGAHVTAVTTLTKDRVITPEHNGLPLPSKSLLRLPFVKVIYLALIFFVKYSELDLYENTKVTCTLSCTIPELPPVGEVVGSAAEERGEAARRARGSPCLAHVNSSGQSVLGLTCTQ